MTFDLRESDCSIPETRSCKKKDNSSQCRLPEKPLHITKNCFLLKPKTKKSVFLSTEGQARVQFMLEVDPASVL